MTALGQLVNLDVAWEKPEEAEKWRVLLPQEPVKQESRSLGRWHKRLGLKLCAIGVQSSSVGDRRLIVGGRKLAVGQPEWCVDDVIVKTYDTTGLAAGSHEYKVSGRNSQGSDPESAVSTIVMG